MIHKKRVGVLRGGPSNEYEVSLKTGGAVLNALRKHHENKYHPVDVFIDKKGVWHIDGVALVPEKAIKKLDVVCNCLHGNYGEDGKVQAFLEAHGIPFTGSGSLASALGMNKILTKKIFEQHGIKTPAWREVRSSDFEGDKMDKLVHDFFHTLHLPVVVKPTNSGSSVGVTIVRYYKDLPEALREASKHDDSILIEEFINGIEATCGVIENFRNQELYALPPIEIRPHTGFFDYAAKYQGKSDEIVPATFAEHIKLSIEDISKKIHQALGLKHYSRSDFMIHPKRGIYALEVNILPGLTDESLIPKALRAVGSDLHELIDHIIVLSLEK